MPEITLAHVRSFFSTFHRQEIKNHTLQRAGVLVPLCIQNGQLSVLLTRRTDEVEHHKGQISFPGGTMEDADTTIRETALREAGEEIGLTKNFVEVLGLLSDFCTPSGFCITPVAGYLPVIPPFILNKAEVSEVFYVPLSFFLDPCHERMEAREHSGKIMNVYFYRFDQYEIWGATAGMLRIFLHAVTADFSKKKTL